jgi:hypothetical protein
MACAFQPAQVSVSGIRPKAQAWRMMRLESVMPP